MHKSSDGSLAAEAINQYGFAVLVTHDNRTLSLYKGPSATYAGAAYWQAVNTFAWLRSNGKIELVVTLSANPYGTFATTVENGHIESLHTPTGKCVDWMTGSCLGDHSHEKVLATVPGMPGPLQPAG